MGVIELTLGPEGPDLHKGVFVVLQSEQDFEIPVASLPEDSSYITEKEPRTKN